jgi:multidrug efflux pump subunit AcrA (membrane-fusion protein)
VVSQQDLDEAPQRRGAGRANVAAADANVQRLRQLEGFKRVVAPFAGVITRRNVDIGDLIDGGGGARCSCCRRPIRCACTSTCRRPTRNSSRPGQPVVVTQAELRGQTFKGQVARTAGSIDADHAHHAGRGVAAQPDGALLPGAFVQVSLPLAASRTLTVPSNALLFRGRGHALVARWSTRRAACTCAR